MNSVVEKLEEFELERFINAYQLILCRKTTSPNQVASALNFTFDEIAIINHSPDNFSKCEKLYEIIQKNSKVRDFVEALKATGNDHVIDFVQSVLTSGQPNSGSSNLKTGIRFNIPESIESNTNTSTTTAQSPTLAPTPSVQTHFTNYNYGPSQNSQGNVNCNFTQNINVLPALHQTGSGHVINPVQSLWTGQPLASGHSRSTKSPGIWFNIPEPIESFYGRKDFLRQLHDKLQGGADSMSTLEVTVLSQVKIVSGLGGIGKSETARRYIMEHRKSYNNFIWINAETDNSMTNSFRKLAEELKIPVVNSEEKPREIAEIVKEIYNKICGSGESKSKTNLIIFDNAEDFQSCQKFLPFGLHPDQKRPVILATSRNQEWTSRSGKIQVLPLDVLTDDESLEFILTQLEIEDSPGFREESKEFIQLIGGLPLALQQAVAYIKNEKEEKEFLGKSYKIGDYVLEFKSSMKKFLTYAPLPGSSATVFVTWNVTFEKIQGLERGKEAVRILELVSFLYADKIPLSFLHDVVPEIPDGEFSATLKLLKKYSLIKANSQDFFLSIHRQLQFVILQYLKECDDVSSVVMNLVEQCSGILQSIKLSESSDIFLNVHQIVSDPFNLIPMTEIFLDFMHSFASILYDASRYSESLELCKKSYGNRRELLGENDPNTLDSQHQIDLLVYMLRRFDEALTLYKEVLKKQEIHPDLGVDHLSTIITKHNIALVLRNQGKYDKSLELLQQVVAQMTRVHGENHPQTLISLNQMAQVHSLLGDFSKALELYEHVEKKQTEILGPDDTNTLATKQHKAQLLFKMGQIKEASRLFNELYEKQKEILGENHLHTIVTLGSIAQTLEFEGKLAEVLDLYKKRYRLQKENLGENHPRTITSKETIAFVLQQQQSHSESLELLEQVLAQKVKVHGENSTDILSTQGSIALVNLRLGNFSKALNLFEHVEKKQTQLLGPDQEAVLFTNHNKAFALYKMGKLEEASRIFNEIYKKRKEIFGDSHFNTIRALYRIGTTLEKQREFKQALNQLQKVYESHKGLWGEDHLHTVKVQRRITKVENKLQEQNAHL